MHDYDVALACLDLRNSRAMVLSCTITLYLCACDCEKHVMEEEEYIWEKCT